MTTQGDKLARDATLREWYAGQALGSARWHDIPAGPTETIADLCRRVTDPCVQLADALLAALAETPGQRPTPQPNPLADPLKKLLKAIFLCRALTTDKDSWDDVVPAYKAASKALEAHDE